MYLNYILFIFGLLLSIYILQAHLYNINITYNFINPITNHFHEYNMTVH